MRPWLPQLPRTRAARAPALSPVAQPWLGRVAWLLLSAATVTTEGAALNDWALREPIEVSVPVPGLIRLTLAPEVFDAAQPDLADLRLVDPAGAELPYLIDWPQAEPPVLREVRGASITVAPAQTRITFDLTNAAAVLGVTFETPAREFLKAATVEAAPAEGAFVVLVDRQPLFRQGNAQRLFIELTPGQTDWQRFRVTLDDSRSAPIPIAAVRVQEQRAPPPAPLPVPARILERVEGPGESRLTVDLGANRLPVVGVRVETAEPLFARQVTVLAREWNGDEVSEKTLGAGSIYRVKLEGGAATERLDFPVRFQAARELILSLDHGDSPPLSVTAIEFRRAPIALAFLARQTGTHQLFVGNPRAGAARYDVAPLAAALKRTRGTQVVPGTLQPNSDFHPSEPLPEAPVFGAPLTPVGWAFRRAVKLAGPGVQRLELSPHVLAHAQPGLGDLRLVASGKQVLYLLERSGFARVLDVTATRVAVKDEARLSRWSLRLPQPRLPVTRLRVDPVTAVFQRDVQLYEEETDRNGAHYRHQLGRASWVRIAGPKAGPFEIVCSGIPDGDTLFLETDNGDNAPLELEGFHVFVPLTRILFKAPAGVPLELCYGNPQAAPVRYDLSLMAAQVLAAPKSEATFADADPTAIPTSAAGGPIPASVWFYGVLVLVVVGLVLVIHRLLPRRTPA